VPTVAEQGFEGYEIAAWFGVQAPAGTPEDIVTRLAKEIQAAVQSPALKDKMAELGAEPAASTPQSFKAFMAAESEKWKGIVKLSGATAE
jgi:tripartite-type tricarboxylate transporter receptor subunit TctC